MGLEEELGVYTFLPWVKSGLGAHIVDDTQSLTGPRTNLDIQINIKRYTLEGVIDQVDAPKRTVELMGPGDVVGINKSFIVRRDPEPNSRNVESNYFTLIEFNQPDFPWRFTPVKPSADSPNKLTPWISLIILTRDEFEGPHNGIILPEITINDPTQTLFLLGHQGLLVLNLLISPLQKKVVKMHNIFYLPPDVELLVNGRLYGMVH
ncbi:unnamed protein product [marine sediment metagenome]|uniref:Uncharacterized protein n=1 Tax=marine sediment metagenome TaxID=412755 RepID=X1BEQ3_9ZZZZ